MRRWQTIWEWIWGSALFCFFILIILSLANVPWWRIFP